MVLVDHNRLAPVFEQYSRNVVGIVDHHIDEGLFDNVELRIIKNTGSTATLVGLEFKKSEAEISKEIAMLLCGIILLDTVSLERGLGRVSDGDVDIVELLSPLCTLSREEYFRDIQRKKFNGESLGTADLLRKDYKEYLFKSVRCGISSVLLSVEKWAEKDQELALGLRCFASTRKLDVLWSVGAYDAPEFRRDLVVYCKSKKHTIN